MRVFGANAQKESILTWQENGQSLTQAKVPEQLKRLVIRRSALWENKTNKGTIAATHHCFHLYRLTV